jgi:hypothetical protein
MNVLTESEMAARMDFVRPLKQPAPERESIWCIPFEFGPGEKGTRISISKAREIASELRASIAEAEKRQLQQAFDEERKRGDTLCHQYSEEADARRMAEHELAELKRKARSRRRDKAVR